MKVLTDQFEFNFTTRLCVQGGRPPPNEDSTPNETLSDQVVRLQQLLSGTCKAFVKQMKICFLLSFLILTIFDG